MFLGSRNIVKSAASILLVIAMACSAPQSRAPRVQPDPSASAVASLVANSRGTFDSVAPTGSVAAATSSFAVLRSVLEVDNRKLSLHLPSGVQAPLPTVLVFHSAMGRTESTLRWCDRLAEQGFAAVAFDFYDGVVARSTEDALTLRDAANTRVSELQALVELTYEEVRHNPQLLAKKRFLLGWSFGAAWATYSLVFLPNVDGVVAYYGQAFSDNPQLFGTLDAPLLFVSGELDSAPAPSRLEAIVEELKSNGKQAQLRLLPTGHGFAEAAHPGYNELVADQAWELTLAFLREQATAR
jgi:carboxymethylenebutenolidase